MFGKHLIIGNSWRSNYLYMIGVNKLFFIISICHFINKTPIFNHIFCSYCSYSHDLKCRPTKTHPIVNKNITGVNLAFSKKQLSTHKNLI